MKSYAAELQLHLFINSALNKGERSASLPGRFTPEGKVLITTSKGELPVSHLVKYLSTPVAFTPQEIFLLFISVRGCQPQVNSAIGRIMSMENSNDTIGNRTRDLPACNAVPQPTGPARAMRLQYTL